MPRRQGGRFPPPRGPRRAKFPCPHKGMFSPGRLTCPGEIGSSPPARRTSRSARQTKVPPRRGSGRSPRLSPKRRSEEHTSELQSRENLVCRLLLEKKKALDVVAKRVSPPRLS